MSVKDKKVPNVPNLRFKGFDDEYTKYRCSDFLNFYPTNSLSWDDLTYVPGDFYNIHYGLIHNGAPTSVDLKEYQLPSIKSFKLKKYTLCENGDVIFADASEDTEEICKPIEITNTAGEKIVSGLHTIHGRDMKNLTCVGYKGYLFSSFAFHKQVFRLTQGTKVYSISSNNFKDLYVSLPSKKEQEKVVNLMQVIDKRIETQNKIIKDLETINNELKRAQFSKIKKSVPNNLFSDIFNEYKEFNSKELTQYTVGKKGIVSLVSESNYNTDKHIVFHPGTCILGIGIDEIGISRNIEGCCSPIYKTYNINHDIAMLDYIYHFSRMYFDSIKRFVTQKSTRREYEFDYKALKKIKLYIPSIEEQSRLINLFNSFESKIEKEKDILKCYEAQKVYLLRNLFI